MIKTRDDQTLNGIPSLAFNGTLPTAPQSSFAANAPARRFNRNVIVIGLLMSLAGFVFGYEGGSISGYLTMPQFVQNFGRELDENGEKSLGQTQTGLMVSFLCIGCLIGSLFSARLADKYGRKSSIIAWNLVYIAGNLIAITASEAWVQILMARLIGGLGVGALSVLSPMYLSETAPRQLRTLLVASYQLLITLGIFAAYCVNFGIKSLESEAPWRITMGCGFISPIIMAIGVCFIRESPRWDIRNGRQDAAAQTLASMSGVSIDSPEVQRELREIADQFDTEKTTGKMGWLEMFRAPAMQRRILIGVLLQASQQWTGVNFFIYYGTSIFTNIGLSNSYTTSMILGAVNVLSTVVGLWVCQRLSRRVALIAGGVWMCLCLVIYASMGTFAPGLDSATGSVMITFTCLFLFGCATTSGVLIWVICSEIFPTRYRATAMGICTASNWTNNFLISFFTPYITGVIGYAYGYVFAACNLVAAMFVYFYVIESQGRSLEEVDLMYVHGVVPRKSARWGFAGSSSAAPTEDNLRLPHSIQIEKATPLESIKGISQEA